MPQRPKDIKNQIFGDLRTLEYDKTKFSRGFWKCECIHCGDISYNLGPKLTSGFKSRCQKCFSLNAGYASLYRKYQISAENRNLEFQINSTEFKLLVSSNCSYCDYPPSQKAYGKLIYNGIDRVDNTKGYTIENSVPCCKFCNFAKGKSTREEFKSWLNHLKQSTQEFWFAEEEISEIKNFYTGISISRKNSLDLIQPSSTEIRQVQIRWGDNGPRTWDLE